MNSLLTTVTPRLSLKGCSHAIGGVGTGPLPRAMTFPPAASGWCRRPRGFRMTIKGGEVTYEGGEATGAMPGRLIRGPQGAPRAVAG